MPQNGPQTNASLTESSKSLRRKAEEAWLRLIRTYTFHTPIKKGKYRLFQEAMRFCRLEHHEMDVRAADGRLFCVDLSSGMENTVFFHGEYEPVLTSIASKLIMPGSVCLDVGANFGWYTTLFATLAGPSGAVHAFEPVPRMFAQLEKNLSLFPVSSNVFINRVALGDKCCNVVMNLFEGEPTGHASLASKGRTATTFECSMTTLDSYLHNEGVEDVDFVKVDIEGAELMFLEGARQLFRQETPPVLLMEMALEQTKHFGYLPTDLLAFLACEADYLFYSVDEVRSRVSKIKKFDPFDVGANVFCIPTTAVEKHKALESYLDN